MIPRNITSSALAYGKFVRKAYQVFGGGTAVNPDPTAYGNFFAAGQDGAGYKLVANLQMDDFIGNDHTLKYFGFLAASTTAAGTYVAAIRGTEGMTEWWDDAQFGLVPYPTLGPTAHVCDGFSKIYGTLRFADPAGGAVAPGPWPSALAPDAGVRSLVVVGHSLGAALATLYAPALVKGKNFAPQVYTLASPKVGDQGFTTAYNSTVEFNYRVYNQPDLVPTLPPFPGYDHVKGGYAVDSAAHPFTVRPTLPCAHELNTYLYLLGAPAAILGGAAGCGY